MATGRIWDGTPLSHPRPNSRRGGGKASGARQGYTRLDYKLEISGCYIFPKSDLAFGGSRHLVWTSLCREAKISNSSTETRTFTATTKGGIHHQLTRESQIVREDEGNVRCICRNPGDAKNPLWYSYACSGPDAKRKDEGERNPRAARRPPGQANRNFARKGNSEDAGRAQGIARAGQLNGRNLENVVRWEMQAACLEAHVEQMFDCLDDVDVGWALGLTNFLLPRPDDNGGQENANGEVHYCEEHVVGDAH
uniref:Uncharacterized protein n=1 Tax=Vitis vinifera TaxID=29760 RepID=A5ADM5_VITVI|nr:hypothetical protein VITISV_001893 [Vitis vinifera]